MSHPHNGATIMVFKPTDYALACIKRFDGSTQHIICPDRDVYDHVIKTYEHHPDVATIIFTLR